MMIPCHLPNMLYINVVCIIGIFSVTTWAEKELMYDSVKGIIFVDKKGQGTGSKAEGQRRPGEQSRTIKKTGKKKSYSPDIHVGRKKDPPDLYFQSGLEYYRNNDFDNALKNFRFAESLEHSAEYSLLIGKTLRKLGLKREMIKVMYDIVKNESGSDVADDALLELALFYKAEDDYDKATQLFTRIIEVYPFGTEFSTGEDLPEIAREQRRLMRAEMINLLTTLGFTGEDLQEGFRKFQEAKHLPVTETGDSATVKALRAMHRDYLRQEDRKAVYQQQVDRFMVWMYGAIAAGSLNLILLIVLFMKTRVYRRHVLELQKIISELNVEKL